MKSVSGLPKSELQLRRKQLMRMMEADSIAIIPAASEHIRNRDVEYPYRQGSDFLYLTDFSEPEAVAVFIRINRTSIKVKDTTNTTHAHFSVSAHPRTDKKSCRSFQK